MQFVTTQLSASDNYQLLVGGVAPRPIAWISSVSAKGVTNVAPYSFFSVASCDPPVLMYTQVTSRTGDHKDTLRNLLETHECVVNIVDASLVDQMNASCAPYAKDVSEFDALGIEPVASHVVAVPGVAAARIRYECRLREVIPISTLPLGGTMVLLSVVAIYVDDQLLVDGIIDPSRLKPLGKLGGNCYATTDEQFELARP